ALLLLELTAQGGARPPSHSGNAYGEVLNDTHGATVVFANYHWLTLWHAHSGTTPMPPPGYIQINFTTHRPFSTTPDRLLFILNDDEKRTIEAEGYPYLRLSLADAEEIAKANTVKVVAIDKAH